MEFFLVIVVLALSCAVGSCISATSSAASTYDIGMNNSDDNGRAFRFPVFHKDHPSLSSWIQQTSNVEPAAESSSTVTTRVDDTSSSQLRQNVFFMAINLGTPPVPNLVTIDTASSLSWVQCGRCDTHHCHWQQQAGTGRRSGATTRPVSFNPFNSSTYQTVRCSSEACRAIHKSTSVTSLSACVDDETDDHACLYRIRYALGEYSVGYLGKEKLTLPNGVEVDEFVFGCGGDNLHNGLNAGIVGFGDESYSFFNQVVNARRRRQQQQTNNNYYRAFSYCFPSSHENEGFLSIGPYATDNERLMTTRLINYGSNNLPFYAIQQADMMVNGISLEVDDPRVYTTAVTIIDSGTTDTFILSPVFHALDKAVTTAMLAKGYVRRSGTGSGGDANKICFVTAGDSVNWGDLPVVEMKFGSSATLVLRMENAFYVNADDDDSTICLTFQPDYVVVRGVQILGNRALRSFRVVHDVQDKIFGFQAGAC